MRKREVDGGDAGELHPQHDARPSASSAHAYLSPHASVRWGPDGADPDRLSPQHRTPPPVSRPHVCTWPGFTYRNDTPDGTLVWPQKPYPAHDTVVPLSQHVWCPPESSIDVDVDGMPLHRPSPSYPKHWLTPFRRVTHTWPHGSVMYATSPVIDPAAGGDLQFDPQLHDATSVSSDATNAQLDELAANGRRMHICARRTGSDTTAASGDADNHAVGDALLTRADVELELDVELEVELEVAVAVREEVREANAVDVVSDALAVDVAVAEAVGTAGSSVHRSTTRPVPVVGPWFPPYPAGNA